MQLEELGDSFAAPHRSWSRRGKLPAGSIITNLCETEADEQWEGTGVRNVRGCRSGILWTWVGIEEDDEKNRMHKLQITNYFLVKLLEVSSLSLPLPRGGSPHSN